MPISLTQKTNKQTKQNRTEQKQQQKQKQNPVFPQLSSTSYWKPLLC